MQFKKITKIISVVLALALMVSSLPLNFFHFLNGKTFAEESEQYKGAIVDTTTGKVTNKDEATYKFNTVPTNTDGNTDTNVYIWLSEFTSDAIGRKYKLEFYSENNADLTLYFKDFINIIDEEVQPSTTDLLAGTDENVNSQVIVVKPNELLEKKLIVTDNNVSLNGLKFFGVANSSNEEAFTFPLTGLDCAALSNIKIVNAKNGIVTYTNEDNLKLDLEVTMNGPFEMFVYDTKFDNLDISGKKFEDIISSIDESVKNTDTNKSNKYSFTTQTFTVDSAFLKKDATADYTIILKDKFGHVATESVKAVRDVKLVNVHLVTSPNGDFVNDNALPILTDKYGTSVKPINVSFVTQNTDFTFDIPTIKGYTFIKTDIGTVEGNQLKYKVSSDTDIYVYYEAFAPKFDFSINSANQNVYPQNPLSQYPNSNANIFSFKIENLANNGNVDFENGSIVIKLPQKDSNGVKFNLKNMVFNTGTFINVKENATMTIFYSENGTVYNAVENGTINLKTLTEVKEIDLPDSARFIKLELSKDALVKGATIGTKPTLDFTLEYDGEIEEQDFVVTSNSTINYIDDENKAQKIEKEDTASSKIVNPIHTLTIKYVNKLNNEEIKTTLTSSVKYHNLIDIDIDKVTILGYKFANTEFSSNLVEKNDAKYMPNSDVTITHYYFEKKPYIAETQITSRYENVYINDSNVLHLNDIGAYLKSESEGNVAMYEYKMLISIPAEFQLRRLSLPQFAGNKVPAKIEYKSDGDANWKEYKEDAIGESAVIDSKNSKQLEISNMYKDGEASALQLRLTYGNLSVPLPSDFKAQGSISLTGTIASDDVSVAKVSLKTSVTYPDEISGEEKVFSNETHKDINIYQPSIADVEESGNLTVPNSDKYTYVFKNIKNDGSAPLKDFKFIYDFASNTYLDNINIGVFKNVPQNSNIVVETTFADDTKKENVISYAEIQNPDDLSASKIEFSNTVAVKKVTITFGNVPSGFANIDGIKITTFSRLDDEKDTDKLIANAELTATWKSENGTDENSGVISKKFTTETIISRFNKIEASISISNPIVLPSQTTDVSINHLNNKYNIDLFNVQNSIYADDESTISKLTTGAYDFTSKYDFEKLVIYAYTTDGITKIFDDKIPSTSTDLDLPSGTLKVAYTFSVISANFKTKEKPVITFVTKALDNAHIKNEFKYNVGVYDTNIKITDMGIVENLGTTQTSSTTDEAGLLTVGNPSVVKPTFVIPESTYFSDTVVYKANGIKNDGNISLYQTVIGFVPSEFEIVKAVNIGKWSENVSGTIGFATVETIDGEQITNLVEVKKFDNVKELESVEIPTSEKQIVLVYIIINEIKPNVEIISDAYFDTKLDTEKVQPKSILNGKIAFNTNYGIVKDGNNITEEETSKLTNIALTEQVAEVLVVKPSIVFPNMTVSSEIVEYRGQFSYTISNIKNTGNTSLDKLEIVEMFSPFVRFLSLKTPVFNELTTFDVYYRTNVGEEWVLLQEGVNARESVELFAPELSAGEYVSFIKFVFKDGVKEEFASTSDMTIDCINWSSAYSIEDIVSTTEINANHTTTVLSARNSVYYTPEIPSILQAGFEVVAPEKIYPGQKLELVYKNIKNVSEATINKHTLTQYLTSDYKVIGINTGSYESGYSSDTLRVLYRTNLSKEGQMFELKGNIPIAENMFLEFPDLVENEFITEISIKFGDTKEGFKEITSPSIILEPLDTIKNSSQYSLDAELVGLIDEKDFGEIIKIDFVTDYGFVTVVAKDTNGKTISTYKVYGNVGENFTINEVALKGYKTISADGDVSGTYKLGESGNITFTCKEVPKTGYEIITNWKFILGSIILIVVGTTCFIPKKKKAY